ncbi:MAG: rhamnosyltransferase WsaF family glycosyltransferase [Thermoleophilia bacterium]
MTDYSSLVSRAIDYYQTNGARQLLRRGAQKVALRGGSREAPAFTCAVPREAAALPIKRVENASGRPRLTLVIPSVDRQHLFAGSWTALKIFWETVRAHEYRARIICSDRPYDPKALEGLDFITSGELAGIESWHREAGGYCEAEDDEIFIVTAWWTAYALKRLELTHKVYYLVQDFEPSFYPWSQHYLLARETYDFKYSKIVNTSILYEFMRERGCLESGDAIYFEPAIDTEMFFPGDSRNYTTSGKAVILVYGRPSVPRNLFNVACMSLQQFFRTYPIYREKVEEIVSVGEEHEDFMVDRFVVSSRGKMSLAEWASLARASDVGVSLMSSPHPSYIPLEMVASGMVVVSNDMYNKNLSKVNGNFVTSEPRVEDIVDCLKEALDRLGSQEEITANARQFVASGRSDWTNNLQAVTQFIGGGRKAVEAISKDGSNVVDR